MEYLAIHTAALLLATGLLTPTFTASTATITATITPADSIRDCLMGKHTTLELLPGRLFLFCPPFFGTIQPDWEKEDGASLPLLDIPAGEVCLPAEMDGLAVVLSTVPISSNIPDIYPVITETERGEIWYTMIYVISPGQECMFHTPGGIGTMLAMIQYSHVSIEDAYWVFESSPPPEMSVPSEVVDAEPIQFLPPDQKVRWTALHRMFLLAGVMLLLAFFAPKTRGAI